MAQFDISTRAFRRNDSSAEPINTLRRATCLIFLAASLWATNAQAQAVPANCPNDLATTDVIDHDFSVSFCELCGIGTVRIEIENPFREEDNVDFSDIVVTENLANSGLTYVPGTTLFTTTNVSTPPVVEPVVSGINGSVLTWTLSDQFVMQASPSKKAGDRATLTIEFNVRRHPNVGEEGLVLADRTIEADVEFTPSCEPSFRQQSFTGPGLLPLNEPEPEIIKTGRNLDAGQDANSYSEPVFGHENDDVIWQIEVRNNGLADLQDLKFSDSIVPGNFAINYVCDNEAAATSAATGGAPAGCLAVGGTTDVLDLSVAQVFGGGATPYIAAPAGGSGFYYLVGRITDSCSNRVNTVFDVEWGCEIEPPPGGIAATSTGQTAGDSALLSTQAVANTLDVDIALTGTKTDQPMGSKGTVTITISNNTGGTIKGGATGLRLRDVLPAEYVIDPTFVPTAAMAPAYGNDYPGMLDTIAWSNPAPGTLPLTTTDPLVPLLNTDPQFSVTSSTIHPDFADQFNMIRHGDVLTITFRTVLIDPQYYDLVGNIDVRTEEPNSDPAGTDPTESFAIANQLEIWFEEFCTATEHYLIFNDNDQAEPEDIDVDIIGTELVFILTNTDPLPLTVELTNNGGHDADDYFAYVTFGQGMVVQSSPGDCAPTSNPPSMPVWQTPVTLPATATVYQCDVGVIKRGKNKDLTFDVVKNPDPSADDDLSFRVDVIGEITLSDGTPLWFPAPTPRSDGITDRANNYSLDALRARVIGYNLAKTQLGTCSENNPPPAGPDLEVQVGEECEYHVESGGWFGFQTPGFTYIAVQNIQVVDEIPDGQGYISSTDPFAPGMSTSQIQNVQLNPPPLPLAKSWFDWTFNTVTPAERITVKDHWFRVNVTTRLLNDPIDTSAAPNLHAAASTNVLNSTFEAVFFNPITNMEEIFNLGPATIGFPPEIRRRVDLTVTEPNLTVVKEVCNESIYGTGPTCSNFVTLADDGNAFETYIYRITVTNEASASGVSRAPAYDVTVTSVTDPTDLIFVGLLASDGLDNDGNALVDEVAGEGQIVPDNIVQNGIPAQIVASYTHSDALLRINAGESVVLYYRVDPDDDVAPLQQLTNSVTASYDSLEGDSGNQTAPLGANGEIGGARQYVTASAEATIQIIPVQVSPKLIVRLSNSALGAPGSPQPVSIGEEIEFELRTLIPIAQLRSFVIRDDLPAGISCVEAPAVNLDAPPYSDAGFMPGGVITPTCTNTAVVWNFGDQTVTQSPGGGQRFDFGIRFIARVDNSLANQDGLAIRNGGTSTVANVSYIDEIGNTVVLDFAAADAIVREPLVVLTKTFSVLQADAADVPTVTISATNNGNATAYNLRVLDNLAAVNLSYAGQVGGVQPPNVDITTFGADSPLFSWNPGFAIAPGQTISFTFAVQVAGAVEPQEILSNTVQADWTSLPTQGTALNSGGTIGLNGSATGMRNGALPNLGDLLNDYETEASAQIDVPPVAMTKIDLSPALAPEIGAHKSFQVEISLPEGVSNGLGVSDNLSFGSVSYVLADNADFGITYEFVGIATINGQAPSAAAFTAVPGDGASGTAVWNIGAVVTQSEDDLTVQALNPAIRINYFARINNDLVTNVGNTLQNSASVTYINGAIGAVETLNGTTASITAIESALTATKAISNVTPGKAPTDPLELGDIVQYVVTIPNGGNATAYDGNIVDTLPPELALYGGFVPTATINGVAAPGFIGVPTGAPDSPLIWGAGNGDGSLDIPPGGVLELTYQVFVRTPSVNNIALTNSIWVDWTSLDGVSSYERTGVGCPIITAPNDYCYGPATVAGIPVPLLPPDVLVKANTQATAAIGEPFSYLITIPSTPHSQPLYDVRVTDDLTASAADLLFVGVNKVTGSQPWTPVNTGTATSLVIEDITIGIDIPAGEQIVIEISVMLDDTPTNVSGLTFTNTASYTYNILDGDDTSVQPGGPGTSGPMTIVGPDVLTLEKGGPAQMQIAVPGTFTLNIHNASSAPAFGLTIVDLLPNGPTGGMCDASPAQISAQVFAADGVTPVSPVLVENTDFSASFIGDPGCSLTITMLSASAAIGADQRLIITYQASLDAGTQAAASLTNIAGATEWFSIDVSDPANVAQARTYTRTITDGTPGVLDHEDAHTVTVMQPVLLFEKSVANVSSGENPGTVAQPGDTLRYSLRIENLGNTSLSNFSIVDELDRLNAIPSFQAGTLNVITLPAGADATNTDPNGGAAGTGLLDIRNLSLGGIGASLLIEFEIVLAPVIANGSYVTNQSQLQVNGLSIADSDDPNINGAADPNVAGDEDPTRILIVSAPAFDIDKISTYVDGDPNVLLAGETLRYTITVQNIGTDDALDVRLVDQIPANTTYVAGSTTLNGVSVPDLFGGVSPLTGGILINAPQDPTPGTMRAVVAPSPDNIATIIFDVLVFPDAADGTVISNQAFVSSIVGGVLDQPSDDPRTPIDNDPTRDVIGNLPLIFAEKSAALQIDLGSPNIVDPGDTLRYTITIYNNGAIPATNVSLTDSIPANTTYVADSLTLNGLPVGQPDGGISLLVAGIPVSSTDLTPPLPGAGQGTLSAGQAAIVQFDLRVDNGVASGTLISNQAVVGSQELPDILTDGDGNPSTGPEPTVVVVGNAQQLAISKNVSVVNGGPALAGATLEYVVTVENIAAVPALSVVITDDLDMPVPGYLTYVAQSATMNGLTAGITNVGSMLTADYASVYGSLQPGETIVLRFRAVIDANLAVGTTITNTAVATWNLPPQTVSASVSIDVGGVVGSGALNGNVWHDANFDNTRDGAERSLEGWTVELFRDGQSLRTTLSAIDGSYRMTGLPPNDLTGEQYEIRFSAPGAGATTALLGLADSAYTNDLQRIANIIVASGSNLQNLNLPIDPNGVVYNAIVRAPIAGATLVMVQAGSSIPLPAVCFDDPAQQNQVTLADGYYKFDINFGDPACASGGDYQVLVTAPLNGYVAGESDLIPAASSNTTAPFNVPACPGMVNDAIASTAQHCEAQTSEFAPALAVPARSAGTVYHAHLTLDNSRAPGSSQLFNNHIPLDPVLTGTIAITKSTPMFNVTRGQLVPYIITTSSVLGVELPDVSIIDRIPAGFRYVEGSARLDGVPTEPVVNIRELTWSGITVSAAGRQTLQLLLAVGSAVTEGEFVNRAQAFSSLTGSAMSEEAIATVRLIPDPTFDCTDVTGKVFDDANLNGYQDQGEAGVAGVRLVTARGLAAVTDSSGRYHITCAITPHESRGSNFILKLDDRTLPSGFRVSTRPVQIKRATRGKALRLNFGASIHRVVGLDLADAVFEPGQVEMRDLWKSRIDLLLNELQNGPAILRLSYVADIEDEQLVDRRLKAMQREITDAWKALNCCYELIIEPEVFWRLGGPADVPDVREAEGW